MKRDLVVAKLAPVLAYRKIFVFDHAWINLSNNLVTAVHGSLPQTNTGVSWYPFHYCPLNRVNSIPSTTIKVRRNGSNSMSFEIRSGVRQGCAGSKHNSIPSNCLEPWINGHVLAISKSVIAYFRLIQVMPAASEEFAWPWQFSFPPFFTLQPNEDTRRKQTDAWCQHVLACRFMIY